MNDRHNADRLGHAMINRDMLHEFWLASVNKDFRLPPMAVALPVGQKIAKLVANPYGDFCTASASGKAVP